MESVRAELVIKWSLDELVSYRRMKLRLALIIFGLIVAVLYSWVIADLVFSWSWIPPLPDWGISLWWLGCFSSSWLLLFFT